MTLIEALVAIAILSGVMATAIDTFRFAATRSAVSGMEVEAANLAESLLARAGEDLPLRVRQTTTIDGGTLTWSVDSEPAVAGVKVQLFKVDSHVKIARAGMVVEQGLSTLKLKHVSPK